MGNITCQPGSCLGTIGWCPELFTHWLFNTPYQIRWHNETIHTPPTVVHFVWFIYFHIPWFLSSKYMGVMIACGDYPLVWTRYSSMGYSKNPLNHSHCHCSCYHCFFIVPYCQYIPNFIIIHYNSIAGWWFQPLWKIWQSVGMIIPNIWKYMFQTTNQAIIVVIVVMNVIYPYL